MNTEVMPAIQDIPNVPTIPDGHLKVVATDSAGRHWERTVAPSWYVLTRNGCTPAAAVMSLVNEARANGGEAEAEMARALSWAGYVARGRS